MALSYLRILLDKNDRNDLNGRFWHDSIAQEMLNCRVIKTVWHPTLRSLLLLRTSVGYPVDVVMKHRAIQHVYIRLSYAVQLT